MIIQRRYAAKHSVFLRSDRMQCLLSASKSMLGKLRLAANNL